MSTDFRVVLLGKDVSLISGLASPGRAASSPPSDKFVIRGEAKSGKRGLRYPAFVQSLGESGSGT